MAAEQLSPKRFLFGSDTPYANIELDIHKVRLVWSGEDLDMVMYSNAMRILGL